MASEPLPGFELTARPSTLRDEYDQHAVRAIERVKATHIEDLDKLRETLHRGGTYLEMRAAVDAFRIIDETIRGLEKATDRVLGHDVPEED